MRLRSLHVFFEQLRQVFDVSYLSPLALFGYIFEFDSNEKLPE